MLYTRVTGCLWTRPNGDEWHDMQQKIAYTRQHQMCIKAILYYILNQICGTFLLTMGSDLLIALWIGEYLI